MTLDEALGPYGGPCTFCGRPDARHRVWDAIIGDHRTGASLEAMAWNYNLKPEVIKWIIAQKRFPVPSKKRRIEMDAFNEGVFV